MLKKENRLLKNNEFRKVYKQGRSIPGKFTVFYYIQNGEENNRIGLSVSHKVGKANIRNRIKRIIREICRLHLGQMRKGYDIVIVARSRIKGIEYHVVEKELLRIMKQANILEENREMLR